MPSVARSSISFLRTLLGWMLLGTFIVFVAIWTAYGFSPGLAASAAEPFAALGRVGEFWPILFGFISGGGAAWALAPGLTIHGEDEGERRVSLSPLAAALLGPAALILMFAAYWPCAGVENPVWSSLRRSLEALEGFAAEPFGVVAGCPPEFPPTLGAGILFGKTTLVLVIGIGFGYVFRHSIDSMRARLAPQVVVFAGLDAESMEAARSVSRGLTRRQLLVLLEDGGGLLRARELAREIGAVALALDVTDSHAVQAFMRSRRRRGLQGLHLMSPDAGLNIRAMDEFLSWTGATRASRGEARSAARDLVLKIDILASAQRELLTRNASKKIWRATRSRTGLVPRGNSRTEVAARVVVRIDNPWHAEDWRQRQMLAQSGWLFDAVSANEIAARHLVRQAKDERVEQLVLVGSSPFELAVMSEIAFEHRVDRARVEASLDGRKRWGASSTEFVPNTPSVLLLGEVARDAAEHFQRQLERFGISDADHHIRQEAGTVENAMASEPGKHALVLNANSSHDATFLAARHPNWRIFDWTADGRGLSNERMIGGLSMIGPSLDPVKESGPDIWERLARIKHEIYLFNWQGGVPVTGDSNRGDWDDDLDQFARESNVRSFATFCRSVAALGYELGTDLGDGGTQSPLRLTDDEVRQLASDEHESWVGHHVEYGWRLGDASNPDGDSLRSKKKLHPDIVEWDALSVQEKQKDFDNVASTFELMSSLGFVLVRARDSDI